MFDQWGMIHMQNIDNSMLEQSNEDSGSKWLGGSQISDISFRKTVNIDEED